MEDALQRHRPAVPVDFHHVLGRVASRRFHVGQQHLVDDSLAVDHVAVVQAVALIPASPSAWPEEALGDGQALRPAETHDADAGLARGRGDGDDGVVIHGCDYVAVRLPWRTVYAATAGM